MEAGPRFLLETVNSSGLYVPLGAAYGKITPGPVAWVCRKGDNECDRTEA